jgi:hypothetical protein
LVLLTALFSTGFFPVQSDETHLAWVGKQAANGLVPYGDFFSYFPPLTIYLVADAFKLFGTSLAVLRFLTILWLSGLSIALFHLLRRPGLSPGWSAGAALLYPALYLPYWPVPSHHWFALGFGLLALLAAVRALERGSAALWFVAGAFAALSGLCLQTDGALCCALLFLILLQVPDKDRRVRLGLWAAAGLALPLVAVALIVALQGSLDWAWYDLVVWPSRFYKRQGGFNDVDTVAFLRDMVLHRLPAGFSLKALAPLATLLAALALPVLALVLPAFSPAWTSGDRRLDGRWMWTLAAILLAIALYLRGRADWTHLICYLPFLLFALVHGIDWTEERWRPRVLKGWIAVGLVLSASQWPSVLLQHPPCFSNVANIDADFRAHGSPSLLSLFPEAIQERLPILYLPDGSGLLFHWEPVPPPLDWLMLPSSGVDAPWEYETWARFADSHQVPFIIVREPFVKGFLTEPSPIADLLKNEYRPERQTPWGTIFVRTKPGPKSAAVTPEKEPLPKGGSP